MATEQTAMAPQGVVVFSDTTRTAMLPNGAVLNFQKDTVTGFQAAWARNSNTLIQGDIT